MFWFPCAPSAGSAGVGVGAACATAGGQQVASRWSAFASAWPWVTVGHLQGDSSP